MPHSNLALIWNSISDVIGHQAARRQIQIHLAWKYVEHLWNPLKM